MGINLDRVYVTSQQKKTMFNECKDVLIRIRPEFKDIPITGRVLVGAMIEDFLRSD